MCIYEWDYLFRVKKVCENLVISDIDRKKLDVEIYKKSERAKK